MVFDHLTTKSNVSSEFERSEEESRGKSGFNSMDELMLFTLKYMRPIWKQEDERRRLKDGQDQKREFDFWKVGQAKIKGRSETKFDLAKSHTDKSDLSSAWGIFFIMI